MLRVTILLHIVPVAFCIIVTDPPLKPTDYKYSYDIYDPTTGDHKTQREIKLGDVVKGAYTVVDPDGNRRTVEYTADAKHGFKAVVLEEPITNNIVPAHPAPIQENQEPPIPYRNVYYKSPVYTPIPVQRLALNLAPIYQNSRHEADQTYFTPGNEIKVKNEYFPSGQYFSPAAK